MVNVGGSMSVGDCWEGECRRVNVGGLMWEGECGEGECGRVNVVIVIMRRIQ